MGGLTGFWDQAEVQIQKNIYNKEEAFTIQKLISI